MNNLSVKNNDFIQKNLEKHKQQIYAGEFLHTQPDNFGNASEKGNTKFFQKAGFMAILAATLGYIQKNFDINIDKSISVSKIEDIADEIISTNNLKQKGFKDYIWFEEGKTKIINSITNKDITENVSNLLKKSEAFYNSEHNIAVCLKKAAYALPHELGHSVNHNGLFGKIFKTFSPKTTFCLALIPVLASLLPDPHNKDSKISKLKEFVSNNIGKIIFLTSLPMLADEFLASKHALKFTKQIHPEIYKPLLSKYSKAFSTYLLTIGIASLGANMLIDFKKKTSYSALKKKS